MAPDGTKVEGFWDFSRHPVKVREHLRAGEVGCFLSHCRAWSCIAAGTDLGGHVFEDDAVMAPYAFDIMRQAATSLVNTWPPPVIYADRGWPRALSWEDLEYEPVLPLVPARRILCTKYCTAAYWISRSAARQLLRFMQVRSPCGWLPSDDFMSVAGGVHLGLQRPEMNSLSPLRKAPLVNLYHTEPRTLLTLAVDHGSTEPEQTIKSERHSADSVTAHACTADGCNEVEPLDAVLVQREMQLQGHREERRQACST